MSAQVLGLFMRQQNKQSCQVRLLLSIMGSALCCFKNADRISSKKGQQDMTHESASLITVKIWKSHLGYTQPFKFQYPQTVSHKSFKQIYKDVARTFPNSPYFTIKKHQDSFVETLKKIAVYYPRVGYTQGINFIVGLLLMEGEGKSYAFTIFTKIVTHPDLMCIGLYEEEFPLNRLYCSLLWKILDAKRPNLSQKIKQCGVIDEIWIFQWFMTFFLYSFPIQIVNKFLTFIFTHKKMAHPKLAVAIIIELEPLIMKMEDQFELIELLENLKDFNFWKKNLDEQHIMREADTISQMQVKKYLEQCGLLKNKYWKYFLDSENDRKMKYLKIMDEFSHDRKAFLADPSISHFHRNQKSISVLDSIQLDAIKRMALSMDNKRIQKLRTSNHRSKMWKSDLFSLENRNDQQKK